MINKLMNRGFTLIELLVVIAIIGILASVVLASLNTAREKGEDAQIKANINGMRAQAELYYDDNNRTYGPETAGASCTTGMFTDPNITQALEGISTTKVCDSSDGTAATADATSWMMAAQLRTDANLYYCVDSSGFATTTATVPTGNAAAAVADAACPTS